MKTSTFLKDARRNIASCAPAFYGEHICRKGRILLRNVEEANQKHTGRVISQVVNPHLRMVWAIQYCIAQYIKEQYIRNKKQNLSSQVTVSEIADWVHPVFALRMFQYELQRAFFVTALESVTRTPGTAITVGQDWMLIEVPTRTVQGAHTVATSYLALTATCIKGISVMSHLFIEMVHLLEVSGQGDQITNI